MFVCVCLCVRRRRHHSAVLKAGGVYEYGIDHWHFAPNTLQCKLTRPPFSRKITDHCAHLAPRLPEQPRVHDRGGAVPAGRLRGPGSPLRVLPSPAASCAALVPTCCLSWPISATRPPALPGAPACPAPIPMTRQGLATAKARLATAKGGGAKAR